MLLCCQTYPIRSDPFSAVDLLLPNYIDVTKLYMSQQMSCNKILLHLVQNVTAFYKTRLFITILTTASNLFLSLSRWTQSIPITLLQVHLNNILTSTYISSKCSFSLTLSYQKSCMHFSSPTCVPCAPPILSSLI